MILAEKYRPNRLSEFMGQQDAKEKILYFINNFNNQRKKSILLYGPAGSGKTSLVHAFASNFDYEIIELNASDFRNKKQIDAIAGKAIAQQSLFNKNKLILIDEVDGIAGTKDRGGLQELIRLIQKTKWPVFLIANDVWKDKLRSLRSKTQLVEFKALDKSVIMLLLQKICKKEKMDVSEEILEILAGIARGDARAAINDLQVFLSKKIKLTKEDIISCAREKDENIFSALQLIFKTRHALGAFDNIDMDYNTLFLWLDENLPLEYHGTELKKAYDKLSRADVFKGRIRRQRHWRFLVYIMALLEQGIASAKRTEKSGFTKYKPPSRILKIWLVKQKQAKRKAIAEKLAKATHCSKKQAYKEMPYFKMAFQRNSEFEQFADELKLGQEEMDFFR